MPCRRVVLLAAAALLWVPLLSAQSPAFVPPGMDALAERATFSTSFTFDQSMLDEARQMMPEEDRPIVAQLRSITVHEYRYSAPGMYDDGVLKAVRHGYGGHGWSHVMTKAGQTQADVPDPTRTDVWVRMAHGKVEGAVLLVASERNVTLVNVDGMISPLDLLHLRGHFGIPRADPDER